MEWLYVVLFVCYTSYSYNRKIAALAMPDMMEEGLDASHAGLITSCQMMAFAVSKFAAGVLSDRLNPHLLFVSGLFVSGLATFIFSLSSTLEVFCVAWIFNGLAQGCGWPAIAKILRQRAPASQFGTLWSLLSSSNNFSGSFGPFLSAVIIVYFGWRWSVCFAGCLSIFLCIVYLLLLPFLSKNEEPGKKRSKEPTKNITSDRAGALSLFFDPLVILLSVCFMVSLCTRTATINWGQLYLMKEQGHSQYVASAFISSVETAGFLGRIVAGYVTDWAIRRSTASGKKVTSEASVRMPVAVLFMAGSVVSLHLLCFAVTAESSAIWITIVGALLGMSYYGPIAIVGILASESVPSHLSGTSHAIVGLFGNVGATISGLPFSYLAKLYGWRAVFQVAEAVTAATLLLMVVCRNLKSKLKKEEKLE